MSSPSPQTRIGDYELVRLLGRGGMGDVWMAADLRADRHVAVKFIKSHFLDDPEVRGRFLNEARTLGRLEHDRIVTLYNVVEQSGQLALVLRLIDGVSLADRIDDKGALPPEFVLASARDILSALGFAHERGIIHRDIKSPNVLLDRQDRSFLTDFGIAVGDFVERATQTGFSLGTPDYMSPEQIQTPGLITIAHGAHRSDIYSYGVVLYEMLTGRLPFGGGEGGKETFRIQLAHCQEKPPPLRDFNPDVPAAVEEVVLRSLSKNPADRPQTCAEFLREFEAASLEGTAPRSRASARIPTVIERTPDAASAPLPPAPEKTAPRPPAAARSKGVSRGVWLGLGGLLIVSGISWAVLNRSRPAEAPVVLPITQGPNKITKPPLPTPNLPPNSGTTPNQPGKVSVVNTKSAEAENLYNRALGFDQRQMFCEGQSTIDGAVALDRGDPKYLDLQRSMTRHCKETEAAEESFQEATRQFQSGNYCDGKDAADKAVQAAPGNKTYLALQQRLAKGCNTRVP